jgi:1-deoxy-D-xylulose-5-phosphate synthase
LPDDQRPKLNNPTVQEKGERHEAFDCYGAVPGDGCTHQGIFDITLLKSVPNLFMLSVSSAKDLDICLNWATLQKNPVVIRYPKLSL